MMRAKVVMAFVAFSMLIATGGVFAAGPSAAGLWQAVDDETGQPTGWFIIRDHGGVYDGIIAKMFLKPGQDPNVVCAQCKDDRHNKRWLGLEIIRGMQRSGLSYENGTILDPRDGNVYNAMMTMSADGRQLVVRGYLGISLLGKNQYWTRLPESAYNEVDPAVQPRNAAGAPVRKPGAAKPQNSAER